MIVVFGVFFGKAKGQTFFSEQHRHTTADSIELLTHSLKNSARGGTLVEIKNLHHHLYKLHLAKGDNEQAFRHFKNYIVYRDSLHALENKKNILQAELKHEFLKKEETARLEREKQELLSAAENKKQQVLIWCIAGIVLLALFILKFIRRSLAQKKKISLAITFQKDLIEDKQKEILDSIHYAKRIQMVLLPSEKYIEREIQKLKL
ncbi:MAG: hypothetical protein JWO32_1939 [Bacteroidetes bacterium]|nr:hypothetical protein [Bacteroidota bacterium]